MAESAAVVAGEPIHGSNLLFSVDSSDFILCTSNTITFNTTVDESKTKPPMSESSTDVGLYASKRITGLSVEISAEGKVPKDGTTGLAEAWAKHSPVNVAAFQRGNVSKPYLAGKFVITSYQETSPADGDATYSCTLQNSGAPTTVPTVVSE